MTRGVALSLTIALAALFGDVPHAANGTAVVPDARLTGISARTSANTAAVVIETTAPVAYVATRPDPLTLLLDFRNVAVTGVPQAPAVRGARESELAKKLPEYQMHGSDIAQAVTVAQGK